MVSRQENMNLSKKGFIIYIFFDLIYLNIFFSQGKSRCLILRSNYVPRYLGYYLGYYIRMHI